MLSLALYLLHEACEAFRVLRGEFCEHLTVECDAFYLKSGDKSGIGHAERANTGVYAHIPKCTEVSLLLLAVLERVVARMEQYLMSLSLLFADVAAHAFRARKDIAAVLELCGASFDACHGGVMRFW